MASRATRPDPLISARATIKTMMRVEDISTTHMAGRIGLNTAAELESFLTGEPTQTISTKVYRYLDVPIDAWANHRDNPAPPRLTIVPDPKPESVPQPLPEFPPGFRPVQKMSTGPSPVASPSARITSRLTLVVNQSGRAAFDSPLVHVLLNDETHEVLIVAAQSKSPESFRMDSVKGEIVTANACRTVKEWGWPLDTSLVAVPAMGGLLITGEVAQ